MLLALVCAIFAAGSMAAYFAVGNRKRTQAERARRREMMTSALRHIESQHSMRRLRKTA